MIAIGRRRLTLLGYLGVVIGAAVGSRAMAAADRPPAPADTLVIAGDTPWVVSPDEPESLQRAIRDVQVDWFKVFGCRPTVLAQAPQDWRGLLICFGLKNPLSASLDPQEFPGPESYRVCVQQRGGADVGKAVVATGSDVRGAIYAAYAFSEHVLGVDPWYFWTDHEPARRDRVEVRANLTVAAGPPAFKYRGWFINDEDLLAGWAPDPMRENIFSLDIWERIYETILRLRGNMIVPGTFTFPDETARLLAVKRGLVINDHHINVAGLVTFQWPDNVPYSYTQAPKVLEDAWQACINVMKDWEVVWTVGYRGKHDRPFWSDDKTADTPQARGRIISAAIAKQVEMIRAVQPNAPIIANLWAEGVSLFDEGHIKLPPGITLVWPDDGHGRIRDGGKVKPGQGIYFHTAMLNGRANQLSELVNPAQIYSEVGRFVNAGATAFFLVNVSDVRPVPLTTDAAMRFVWDPKPFMAKSPQESAADFYLDWSDREFGPDVAPKVAEVYAAYFRIPYMRDGLYGEHNGFSQLRRLAQAALDEAKTGRSSSQKLAASAARCQQYITEANQYLPWLQVQAAALRAEIPADRRNFYQAHVLAPIGIHRGMAASLAALAGAIVADAKNDRPAAVRGAENALKALDEVFAAQRAAEYGRWHGFYRNEIFVNVPYDRDLLRVLAARWKEEPEPPIAPAPSYTELYDYQHPVRENYPLFHSSGYRLQQDAAGDSEVARP